MDKNDLRVNCQTSEKDSITEYRGFIIPVILQGDVPTDKQETVDSEYKNDKSLLFFPLIK